MQRKRLSMSFVSFGLSAVLLVSLSIAGGCKARDAGPAGLAVPEGRVVLVKGDVTHNGARAVVEERVADGDHITTGPDSAVEVIFGGGLIARFGSESNVLVDLKKGALTMEKGWFAAVKNADARSIEVITPTVTAAVRGTSLCLKIESAQSTYACTCNGTVHFHPKSGSEIPLTAAQHSARTFTEDGKATEAGLKYHDSKGIEDLAKKINHPLDWTKPSG